MISQFQMQMCLWVGRIPSSLEMSPLNPDIIGSSPSLHKDRVSVLLNEIREEVPLPMASSSSSSTKHRTTHGSVFSVNLDFHA